MERALVVLREVDRKADRRRHRAADHRAGRVRDYQRVDILTDIVGKLSPLCLEHVIVHDSVVPAGHLHDFLYNVVRVERRRMDHCLTAHRLAHKFLKALPVMLQERLPVNHHRPGRYRRVLDLVPSARAHERLDDSDPLTHCAHDPLESIDVISELLRGQNTERPCFGRRRVRCLDPLCEHRNRLACFKVHAVLLELRFHSRPHRVLHRSSDQAVHVVVTAVHADQVEVGPECFGVIFCHVGQNSASNSSLPQSTAYIAGVKSDLCRKKRVGPVGL